METDKQIKVIVTGGTGLVGSNLNDVVKLLQSEVPTLSLDEATATLEEKQDNQSLETFLQVAIQGIKFIFFGSRDCNLIDYNATLTAFKEVQPTYVIHLAAKVGGLFANMAQKATFYQDNMLINLNVIRVCREVGVKRLLCALSSCIYPDKIQYPISEQDLHMGMPHPSNEGYSYAKRMCEVQCRLYKEEFGTDYICFIPTNLYGNYDQYNPAFSHVVPALIRKAYEAKLNDAEFIVMGSGEPLRQFCYAPDLARLVLWQLFKKESIQLICMIDDEEYSIKELAHTIAEIVDVKKMSFDTTKADGQYRKTMKSSILREYLKNFKFTTLKEGLTETIKNFNEQTRL